MNPDGPQGLTSPHADQPPTPGRTRVLCVDDSRDIVMLLSYFIDQEPDLLCVGSLYCADHLVEEAIRLHADIVLLDATMPGKDPVEALRELGRGCPETRTIVYSGMDSAEFLSEIIDAGARGCISKREDVDVIVRAISVVLGGGVVFPKGR